MSWNVISFNFQPFVCERHVIVKQLQEDIKMGTFENLFSKLGGLSNLRLQREVVRGHVWCMSKGRIFKISIFIF